jgi:hypothetical protein
VEVSVETASSSSENGDPSLEREKLAIEREKLAIEHEKLLVERLKARWSAISVIIPLLAFIPTVAYGLWSLHEQARSQFELKVAESVMQSPSPQAALAKAQAFIAMFPGRLSPDLVQPIDPEFFSNRPDAEPKKEFLRLLAEKGLSREEVVKVWAYLFPEDQWVNGFFSPNALVVNGDQDERGD